MYTLLLTSKHVDKVVLGSKCLFNIAYKLSIFHQKGTPCLIPMKVFMSQVFYIVGHKNQVFLKNFSMVFKRQVEAQGY